MINKRLLIKNLLSHNDENSFYDKKLKLSLNSKEGKGKFLKHVCALSNSNPENNSYIIIGVSDEANKIVGVDFFDDSKIQNLVNAYLTHPPKIQYENVAFPRLPRHKVVGLVTIGPNSKVTSLLKNAWKYRRNSIFYRRGSNSMPFLGETFQLKNSNKNLVESLEKNARNNIELTLNGVFDFINNHKEEYKPQYKVFKDQFVLCWAGKKKIIDKQEFFSRVDIELINEQVRIFFSALDDVQISYNTNSFIVTEFILIGLDHEEKHYPLEKTIIHFKDNGKHDIVSEFLFKPPKINDKTIKNIYENAIKIIREIELNNFDFINEADIYELPNILLLSYLNGYLNAPDELKKLKEYFKSLEDKTTYIKYKEAMRIVRKVKYN